MMSAATITCESRRLLKKANKLKAEIAAKRDELRDLIDELGDIADGCEDAVQSLDHAADAMSRLI